MMSAPSQPLDLLEAIAPELQQTERLLNAAVARVEPPLHSMLQQAVGGGKRLRAALVILVGQLFARPSAPFCALAAGIELLHAATLIHDDVVDQAPLRRGSPALHTRWSTPEAVLAGDYLLARSTATVAELGNCGLVQVLANVLCTMSEGEIKQLPATQSVAAGREDYYRSIEAKAASLFAAAAEMAGMLAEAGSRQVAALRRYGHELGLAFQIVDDVLDVIGDEALLGKPAGSDLRQGLVTLPVLCYFDITANDAPVRAVLSGERDQAHVQAALEAIRSSGAITAALKEAQAHLNTGREALLDLPDNAWRDMLGALADYVVGRRR